MVPEIEAAFDAYARLAAGDVGRRPIPTTREAVRAVVERLAELADALPPEQSPRVESVRLALARLGNQLARVAAASATPPCRRRARRDRRRARHARPPRVRRAPAARPAAEDRRAPSSRPPRARSALALDAAPGVTSRRGRRHRDRRARAALPPALAAAIERVLVWLARRPTRDQRAPRPRRAGPTRCCRAGCRCRACSAASTSCARSARGAGGSVLLARARRGAHARRRRARRAQGARLLRRRRAQPLRAGVRGAVPRGGRRAARAARAREPRALRHVRRERAAQADPRDGVRRGHDLERAARSRATLDVAARARDPRRPARAASRRCTRVGVGAPRRQAGERRPARRGERRRARRLRPRGPPHPPRLRQPALRRARGVGRLDGATVEPFAADVYACGVRRVRGADRTACCSPATR